MDREIEDILKTMLLRKPSSALDHRVLAAARTPAPRPWRFVGVCSGVFAMAALIGLAVLLWMSAEGPSSDSDGRIVFEPQRSDLEFFQLTDEGVIFLDDHLPMRQIRRNAFYQVMLIDDEHGIRFERTVPQEELLLVPVQYD